MDKKVSDFNLRVCGQEKGVRPELVERVRLMIEAVLKPVAKKGSSWVYIMTGPSEVFRHTSQYHLEIEPGSELSPRMVHVTMRASLLPDGSEHGMLQLPVDVRRETFVQAATAVIISLNHTGWNEVLPHEVREQAFDVGRPSAYTGLRSNPLVGVNPPAQPVLPPVVFIPPPEQPKLKEKSNSSTVSPQTKEQSASVRRMLLHKSMLALETEIRACVLAERHQLAIVASTCAGRRALKVFEKKYAQYLT